MLEQHLPFASKLLLAAGLMFLTGLLDDVIGLKPWQKLVGQIAGGTWAYWAGVRILNVGGYPTENWLSVPLTILWLVGCANAFNLIDGVDGLACGVGVLAALTMLIAGFLQNNVALALATVPLAGCLLGFLRYNFYPASIFLGDSGSLLIGFLLGCYAVIWSHKSATLLAMTAPIMALAIPLLDTALSIVRRFLRHQSIFAADRGHIHHRLLDRGLTPRRVVFVLYAVGVFAAACSLLQSMFHERYAGLIIAMFCGVACVGVLNLGYLEFGAAGRVLLKGEFRHAIDAQLCVRSLQQSLSEVKGVDDCWLVLREAGRTFGFNEIHAELLGFDFRDRLGNADPESCWSLRIPLSHFGHITFTREFQSSVLPMTVAGFVDVLAKTLTPKLKEFEEKVAFVSASSLS